MSKKKTAALAVVTPKIPQAIQNRLMEKMVERNDEKIIDKIQQRNAHVEAIKRLNKEINDLCTLDGIGDATAE